MSLATSSPIEPDAWQECLYTWEPAGDPFAGILDSQRTQPILDALLEAFSPTKTVEQRRIDALRNPIELIDQLLLAPGASSWADSEHTIRTLLDEVLHIRQHSMLALRHHLRWILDTFQHGPQISITVRHSGVRYDRLSSHERTGRRKDRRMGWPRFFSPPQMGDC